MLGLSLLGANVFSTGIAEAATNGSVQNSSEKVSDNQWKATIASLNSQQINKLDKYVLVKNNQFVLSLDAQNSFSKEEIEQAKKMIESSNRLVVSQHMFIDPETKEAEIVNPFINFAKYNKHYTYATKWFGGRYYFTSNSAVDELAHKFRNHSSTLQVLGVIPELAGALGNLGSAYYNKLANDLEHYNNTHKHNQIYMDLNWNGTYSFHILK